MKKLTVVLIFCFAFASVAVMAQTHSHQGPDSCKYCGMDREKFAHSAMMIEYEDGSQTPTCSIHCAAVDLALSIDRRPKEDAGRRREHQETDRCGEGLLDTGSDVPGVMTKKAKWAFENRPTVTNSQRRARRDDSLL